MGLFFIGSSSEQTEIQCWIGCTIWRDRIINLTYKMKQIFVKPFVATICVLSFITTSNICREVAGQIERIIRHGLGSTRARLLSFFTLCIVGLCFDFWSLNLHIVDSCWAAVSSAFVALAESFPAFQDSPGRIKVSTFSRFLITSHVCHQLGRNWMWMTNTAQACAIGRSSYIHIYAKDFLILLLHVISI